MMGVVGKRRKAAGKRRNRKVETVEKRMGVVGKKSKWKKLERGRRQQGKGRKTVRKTNR